MNPMLISVCRDYIATIKLLASGSLDSEGMLSERAKQSTLHAQLIEMAADRDKDSATSDSYNYALAVIALSEAK